MEEQRFRDPESRWGYILTSSGAKAASASRWDKVRPARVEKKLDDLIEFNAGFPLTEAAYDKLARLLAAQPRRDEV